MFELLSEYSEGQKIFSFGKITKIQDFQYIVAYKNKSLEIQSNEILKKDDWIIFYGSMEDGIVHAEYVENILGVDFNILEKFAIFLRENVSENKM